MQGLESSQCLSELKRTMMLVGRLQNRHATARTSWQVTVPCNWALSISYAWKLSSGPGRHRGRKVMTTFGEPEPLSSDLAICVW